MVIDNFDTQEIVAVNKTREEWYPRVIASLGSGHSITKACGLAWISRQTFYLHRDSNPEFAAEVKAAIESGIDKLEDEAHRRAHDGVERKKFHKGDPIIDPETGKAYVEREYSDRLLEMLLKAKRPEKYRENITISGDAEKPLTIKLLRGVTLDEV